LPDNGGAALPDAVRTPTRFDTKKKKCRIRVELVSEGKPIEIEIVRYKVKTNGDRTHFMIKEANTSREWV
jgi:hypothetical protein